MEPKFSTVKQSTPKTNQSERKYSRRAFSKVLAFRMILPIAFILFVGGLQAVEGGDDALSIDANGDATFSGNATVKGSLRGIGMTPPGGIIMFSGDIGKAFDANGTGLPNTPYEGWQLCNGNNNSPDLRDRFIAAAGRKYKSGEQGGADTVALKPDQMPSHNHGGKTNPSPPLYLNYGGVRWNSKGWGQPGGIVLYTDQSGLPRNRPNQINTDNAGPVPAVRPLTHVHPIPAQGSGAPVEIRPSFYALAFIMRLPSE